MRQKSLKFGTGRNMCRPTKATPVCDALTLDGGPARDLDLIPPFSPTTAVVLTDDIPTSYTGNAGPKQKRQFGCVHRRKTVLEGDWVRDVCLSTDYVDCPFRSRRSLSSRRLWMTEATSRPCPSSKRRAKAARTACSLAVRERFIAAA